MKFLLKFAVLIVVLAIAVPIAQYRTVKPCTMLQKEIVRQAEEGVREAEEEVRAEVAEADVEVDEETQEIAEDVAQVVGDLVVGVTETAARAKVRRMSTGQCIEELTRLKLGLEEQPEP